CYAMTDEQIAEIYSLGRESFFGGQRAFQFQAYPFRMTPVNMARHRNNPNMPFWRMIKEGNDDFEVTKQEPKVDFCEKKYVFDAAKPPNATRDPVFEASAKCPAYVIPDDIAEAVRQKQQRDDAEIARLVARGTPVARLNTGIDGGMNKVFAAKLPDGNTGLSDGGTAQDLSLLTMSRAPGTIPSHVNPPHAPDNPVAAVAAAPSPAPSTRMASVAPDAPSDGFLSSLARKVGLGNASADTTATTTPAVAAKPKMIEARRHPEPLRLEAKKPETKPETRSETRQAAAKPPLKPSVTDRQSAAAPTPQNALVAGAQPIVSSNSFDSRFGAMK
ncbi:MAG: L,D-transpeptidase family protein, partial [Bradyrhizobium sp.]